MSARSPKKLSASERKRFIDARNCTIKCQSIIRMVLEMRNSYLEVKKDNTASEQNEQIQSPQQNQFSPIQTRIRSPSLKSKNRGSVDPLKSLTPLKPASMHISTPLFNRVSPRELTPIVSRIKPASQHVPTPIPQHKLGSTSPSDSKKRQFPTYAISPERRKRQSPQMTRQDVQSQFSEASLHTPTKRRTHIDNSIGQYTVRSHTHVEEKHIHWADKATQRPLVQNTPPPSQPLHRQITDLKPCMDSPDAVTKQSLEEQRLAMITGQRTAYLEQLDRKKARLF